MKILGYVRVSSVVQRDKGNSIKMQIDKVNDFCKLNDFELLEIYKDDGISGMSIEKRDGYKEMLNYMLSNEVDGVVVYSLSRLGRRLRDVIEFMEILKEDLDISIKRNEIIKFGVIDPIDVSPITRQAYNWIYEKVSEEEFQDKESFEAVKEKIKNLVRAYGGAVICNVFLKHKKNIDDVLNWRSGYFLEKQIHKVYSMDQIVKIKKAELSKTNSKYIKKVGT
jgi:site-specific DNA recombinase